MALIILIFCAGLMGASGVILAAAAAHGAPHTGLDGAAYMLLFHAAAILGAVPLTQHDMLWRPLMLAVLTGWVVGAALFAGDVAMRAFAGHRFFPFAAPSGGTILIIAWLVLAGAAACALIRRGA